VARCCSGAMVGANVEDQAAARPSLSDGSVEAAQEKAAEMFIVTKIRRDRARCVLGLPLAMRTLPPTPRTPRSSPPTPLEARSPPHTPLGDAPPSRATAAMEAAEEAVQAAQGAVREGVDEEKAAVEAQAQGRFAYASDIVLRAAAAHPSSSADEPSSATVAEAHLHNNNNSRVHSESPQRTPPVPSLRNTGPPPRVVALEPATPPFAVSEAEGDVDGPSSLGSAFKRAASHPEIQSALLDAPDHVSTKVQVAAEVTLPPPPSYEQALARPRRDDGAHYDAYDQLHSRVAVSRSPSELSLASSLGKAPGACQADSCGPLEPFVPPGCVLC
jgi:hypothetical protein